MKRSASVRILVVSAIVLCVGAAAYATEQGGTVLQSSRQGIVGGERGGSVTRIAGTALDSKDRTFYLRSTESAAPRPFKLNAAGGIDLTTGVVQFGGIASQLGLYTGSGFFTPSGEIFGVITAANGDTLNFTAGFSVGPMGELEATFFVSGGTGRFVDAVGMASGPVTLEPDFTFLISVNGNLNY